jgi:hypothetical protein
MMILVFPHCLLLCVFFFLQQTNEEAKGGKEFVLRAGFPPKDLVPDIDKTIESLKLSGEAITVMWKDGRF